MQKSEYIKLDEFLAEVNLRNASDKQKKKIKRIAFGSLPNYEEFQSPDSDEKGYKFSLSTYITCVDESNNEYLIYKQYEEELVNDPNDNEKIKSQVKTHMIALKQRIEEATKLRTFEGIIDFVVV